MDTDKYLVVYCEKSEDETNNETVDYYEAFIDGNSDENLEAARTRYKEAIQIENIYSASLCKIIDSTDY